MSSPLLRWSVLAFACLWFGMLVPVHQRGQIQLPGVVPAAAPTVAQGDCHESRAVPPCHKKKHHAAAKQPTQQPAPAQDSPAPAKSEGGGCAVCHFIAGLHAPPPATIYVAHLGLLELLPQEDPATAPLRHAALPFHGLDPPTC